jgi:hypothetical protein
MSAAKQQVGWPVNRERFVDAIRLAVQDTAKTSTLSLLTRPPGRKPDAALLGLSAWFNQLGFQDRQNVEHVVEMTAHAAAFGILCVLDGARAIEDGPTKGTLDLRYRRDDVDISLNDDNGEVLHELL